MHKRHQNKYIALGLNIAYYRKKRGYSQELFAEIVNISRTHISNIESPKARKTLSLNVLFNISDALRVPIEDLFKDK